MKNTSTAAKSTRRPEDPRLAALRAAPLDDEPVTAEEAADIAIARRQCAEGKTVLLDTVVRRIQARRRGIA